MQREMLKRLDTLENKLGAGNQAICVIQYLDETIEDAREKVRRWRSGTSEKDVWAWPSSNNEIVIYARHFGHKSDGSDVSGEEYAKWLERNVA